MFSAFEWTFEQLLSIATSARVFLTRRIQVNRIRNEEGHLRHPPIIDDLRWLSMKHHKQNSYRKAWSVGNILTRKQLGWWDFEAKEFQRSAHSIYGVSRFIIMNDHVLIKNWNREQTQERLNWWTQLCVLVLHRP